MTKHHIFLPQHPPYSPDLAPCDYFLFPKLHLAMKGNRFTSIEDIQRSTTSNLNIIPISDIKKSFNALLERANCCISVEGEYFE
ncbi:Histone-lysine N-methyltransferase SETMAR [Anthophora quadrimaculata]